MRKISIIAGVVIGAVVALLAFSQHPAYGQVARLLTGRTVVDYLEVRTAGALSLAGTAITATATELNFLDGPTAGTATASKALVLDANKRVDTLDLQTGNCFQIAGESVRCQTTADITSAELLALNATPIEIVAAPGAGKAIIVHRICVQLDYNSAAYAGIGATEDLAFKYTNASGDEVSAEIETIGFLDQTADNVRCATATTVDQAAIGDFTPVANAAVVAHLLNGEITTGDSPLDVLIDYSILTTEIP